GVADLVPGAPGRLGVDEDLALALRRAARGQRVPGVLGTPVVAALGLEVVADQLAVLAGQRGEAGDDPDGLFGAGHLGARVDQGAGQLARLADPVALGVLPARRDGDVDVVEALGGLLLQG